MLVPLDKKTGKKKSKLTDEEKRDQEVVKKRAEARDKAARGR